MAVSGCLCPQHDPNVLAVLETLQPPQSLSLAPRGRWAAWCLPPTAHPPAFPTVAFVSFASQRAMSRSESPLLGRLWFVP